MSAKLKKRELNKVRKGIKEVWEAIGTLCIGTYEELAWMLDLPNGDYIKQSVDELIKTREIMMIVKGRELMIDWIPFQSIARFLDVLYMTNEYHIKNENSELYLPKVEFWILDDLGLNLRQAMLYKIILQKGYLVWNSEYIGVVLRCGSKTVKRDVSELTERGLIHKSVVTYNGKLRWVLVALYTELGARTDESVRNLVEQGMCKLRALYSSKNWYGKRS